MEDKLMELYSVDVLQRTKLGVFTEEIKTHYVVEKKITSKKDGSYFYTLRVKDFKCINKNPSDLRIIENDLKEIQTEIELLVDNKGHIIRITNLSEIRKKWSNYRYSFRKKNKNIKNIDSIVRDTTELLQNKKEFLASFLQSELGILLFPPTVSGLPKQSKINEVKVFSDFFEEAPLLLDISNKIDFSENSSHLKRFGNLLKDENYERIVTQYFRKLTDKYNLSVHPKVRYIETFDFNKEELLTHSGQILHVEIKNLFEYQQICRVKPFKI